MKQYQTIFCFFIENSIVVQGEGDVWKVSFSKQEKEILKGIDSNNGCRRKVIRTLKAIFKQDSLLNNIPSYALKTALFHWIRYKPDVSWDRKEYVNRVFDMLALIQWYLDQNWLPNYFLPSQNLFRNCPPIVLDNIKNRIRGIRNNKNKFLKSMAFGLKKWTTTKHN